MLKIQHALPFLLLSACAVRQPAPRAWRYTASTLIPPGVVNADLVERTFRAPIRTGPDCLVSDAVIIRRRGSGSMITVHREALLRQPRGWLARWIDQAESQGCIPAGQGAILTARILESVPLPTGGALRLLRDDGKIDFLELLPGSRLQVISPIVRAGGAPAASTGEPLRVTGQGSTIFVDMKASDDLLGVETAWYDLVANPGGRGASIVPVSAQTNIGGKVEELPAPAENVLRFPPETAFYRLFYKADNSEILAAARTRAGLPADADACGSECWLVPRGVGVNPYLRIQVNGAPLAVPYNGTVRAVLAAAKKRPEEVLPTLTIAKPFAGHAVNVEFDRTRQDILGLALSGDEQIRW